MKIEELIKIRKAIKTAEDLADSMQDADVGIPDVEWPNTYDAVWAMRDLVEYVRRHEAFKYLVSAAEGGRFSTNIHNTSISGVANKTAFFVEYRSHDKWSIEEWPDDGERIRSTHTHDEIEEHFRRRIKPEPF